MGDMSLKSGVFGESVLDKINSVELMGIREYSHWKLK
jgi:hypothetical protein